MKVFFSWLKDRFRIIFAFILFAVIFTVSFLLYRLPVTAILYPAMLCCAVGIGFLVYDFVSLRKKHEMLEGFRTLADLTNHPLPETDKVAERDYQEIIAAIRDETSKIIQEAQSSHSDTIDYYTVWAHQIKTPIASMKLALESEDTPLARRLSSELLRIEQYVEMVLAFLRLGSDRTDYEIKETSLDEIIRASVRRFSGEFIDRKLSLDYVPTGVNILTDEKWFAFVLEQILSNALKYTHSGEIKIYMRDAVTLCIQDTGIGIAPEDLPRIFDKGYTGYNGRLDKSATGLGLYLTKRICDNLRHPIYVSSVVGAGGGTVVSIGLERYCLGDE